MDWHVLTGQRVKGCRENAKGSFIIVKREKIMMPERRAEFKKVDCSHQRDRHSLLTHPCLPAKVPCISLIETFFCLTPQNVLVRLKSQMLRRRGDV